MVKKAQAAMEFLMTYGWAVLVVLFAIAALAYFGLLNSERFLPQACTLEPGISCDDFVLDETSATLVLRNGLGEIITITSVTLEDCTGSDNDILQNDERGTFTISGCLNTVSSKTKKEITLVYTGESGISHTMYGEMVAVVEGAQTASSNEVCQNADDNDLCFGLDLVYGTGYQADCCTNYVLCC